MQEGSRCGWCESTWASNLTRALCHHCLSPRPSRYSCLKRPLSISAFGGMKVRSIDSILNFGPS